MSTYFPYLRGKQNEMLALRHVADRIANSSKVQPILELVNFNAGTRISLDKFVEAGMPFVLITNPRKGEFVGMEEELCGAVVSDGPLAEYDNFIPALYVDRDTSAREVDRFLANYGHLFRGVIYSGEPESTRVREWCASDDRIYWHIVLEGTVPRAFVDSIPRARKVLIYDHFKKQIRNADYPERELFTDLNVAAGNPTGMNWGDFSIQGDNYSETGGPAYAVCIHHISRFEDNGALYVNHYLSDRQETTADTPGKIIEATVKLVRDLPRLLPNDTDACDGYRRIATTGNSSGLGYLKRLAILHHLEIMLNHD